MCNRVYCAVNTGCDSWCQHRKLTSRTHMHSNLAIVDSNDVTIVATDSRVKERLTHTHTLSNNAIWDFGHDIRRDLAESQGFSLVNNTWVLWDSVRIQVKPQVKSQVKSDSEYGPCCLVAVEYMPIIMNTVCTFLVQIGSWAWPVLYW